VVQLRARAPNTALNPAAGAGRYKSRVSSTAGLGKLAADF